MNAATLKTALETAAARTNAAVSKLQTEIATLKAKIAELTAAIQAGEITDPAVLAALDGLNTALAALEAVSAPSSTDTPLPES